MILKIIQQFTYNQWCMVAILVGCSTG